MKQHCNACGQSHEMTTAGCPLGYLGNSPSFNSPGSEWTAPPGVVVDTGVIHRAPLLAKIETLEAALDAERQVHAATRGLLNGLLALVQDVGRREPGVDDDYGLQAMAECVRAALDSRPTSRHTTSWAEGETPVGTGYGKPSNSPLELLDLDTGPAR